MLRHPEITLKRIKKFLSQDEFGGKIYPERAPVQLSVYSAPDRISYAEAMHGTYRPAHVGEKFGPLWSTHWFRVEFDIPKAWAGRRVDLLWDSYSEACVWQDGEPLQGLTGSESGWSSPSIRKEYCVTRQAQGGEHIVLYVEIACNGMFGTEGGIQVDRIGTLLQAEIAAFDPEAWDVYWDLVVISDMAQHLNETTPRAGQALYAANAMVNAIDPDDRSTWQKACAISAEFFSARNGDAQLNLSAVGHAHIDSAWLWPVAETKRKAVRTFSTAIRNLSMYPEFLFACSQAAQYEWVKQNAPGLYQKIKEQVKAGRFIPVGGSWIEPDCNLTSGESLVRQFLFGQRFFRQEFGITCHEFWSPDAFGYSAVLPQILAGVGIRYFISVKLSRNQFNILPSHSFLWEGLDGTRTLTHFPSSEVYISEANVKEVVYASTNFQDHDRARESYLLFGWGDGGGGPTAGMLEQLKRMRDVDGLPRVQIRPPEEFFHRLETDLKEPMVWVGELYFETHRGTYTSQARNKLHNRKSEFALHDVELLSSLALAQHKHEYPAQELNRLWKLILFNQFHDILPGSSIREVYDDTEREYGDVFASAAKLQANALNALVGESSGSNLCAINTLSFPRTEVVELPTNIQGQQVSSNGTPLGVISAPPIGYAIGAPITTESRVAVAETDEKFILENGYVRATFHRDGHLMSLYDLKKKRESIAPNARANQFVMFDDNPNIYDAWDVDVFHLEKPYKINHAATRAQITERGPLRAAIEFEYALTPKCSIKQTVSLTAISPRLDFTNEVEWYESHKILKVEFPLNLRAQNATYEIQFGHLQRPTHYNTSWDVARFEVYAHKWADLSEPDYGVALLNDCKYGHSTYGNIIRLSLLRAPKNPDPSADQGHHTFRYALLPHAGSPQQAGVIDEAYRFNVPLLLRTTDHSPETISFFSTNSPALVIDTIKKAEDSNDLIVRLYEAHGTHGTFRLTSTLPIQSAIRTNLLEDELENEQQPLEWSNGGVNLNVTPFQIITIKLKTCEVGDPKDRMRPS
ncbi:MAG TPA: glycoside hydrolase family 38 C-terminal domain-containing protein [Anaerolineae bacterium]|nr:glycoside hydrolase family 38 C-terminal domain-containing protein [Anaerolineae bacterium]